MAKRKRLTPAQAGFLDGPAPETKSMSGPPIAQVAGEASAQSALQEMTRMVEDALSDGRMVRSLPLDRVRADYLVRDRAVVNEDDMQALVESLKSRGQQTPIEVVALEDGAYGLISGWRRLTALRQLRDDTGEERFTTVEALERSPDEASDAYVAMVEENEIRVGLSYFERARIVIRAVEEGVYKHEREALNSLFARASRAKRSKIGSFMPVVVALDGKLRFPGALTERLGLQLARLLEGDSAAAERLADRLRKADPQDAEAEQAVLARALSNAGGDTPPAPSKPARTGSAQGKPAATLDKPEGAEEVAHGVYLEQGGGYLRPRLTLSGPRVDEAFRNELLAWIKARKL